MAYPIDSGSSLTRKPLQRRQVLRLIYGTLLGLGSILTLGELKRFFSFQPYPSPPTRFDLGPANELPLEKAFIVEEAQAILIPFGNDLVAFSLVCPHLGCIVEFQEDGFSCPCHSSEFHQDGTLRRGPSEQPLRSLKLEINTNGHMILDTSDPTQKSIW